YFNEAYQASRWYVVVFAPFIAP
ncbi:hypothetical protein Q604_UNBC03807G0001, partial [human gut metagenome]